MKRTRAIAAAAVFLAASTTGLAQASAHEGFHREFDEFTGVPQALIAPSTLRDITGGGVAWTIGEASVTIEEGTATVDFQDLFFATGPATGTNTIPSMAVVLSCSKHGVVTNVKSASFPVTVASAAGPGGAAHATVSIATPEKCHDPLAFITNGAGTRWFAVSELED